MPTSENLSCPNAPKRCTCHHHKAHPKGIVMQPDPTPCNAMQKDSQLQSLFIRRGCSSRCSCPIPDRLRPRKSLANSTQVNLSPTRLHCPQPPLLILYCRDHSATRMSSHAFERASRPRTSQIRIRRLYRHRWTSPRRKCRRHMLVDRPSPSMASWELAFGLQWCMKAHEQDLRLR